MMIIITYMMVTTRWSCVIMLLWLLLWILWRWLAAPICSRFTLLSALWMFVAVACFLKNMCISISIYMCVCVWFCPALGVYGNDLLHLYILGSHCFMLLPCGCLWWWLACLFQMQIEVLITCFTTVYF